MAQAQILVVDDQPVNIALLTRMMASMGCAVRGVENGQTALKVIAEQPPDLILLDVQMPGLSGFDVCRTLKHGGSTRLIPVVLITGLTEMDDHLRGIEAGADDFLTKPFNPVELRARVKSLLRMKQYTDQLESAESVILSLGLTIEARDPNTQGHCHRLSRYADRLGTTLGMSDEQLLTLNRGAFLHDVGKVGIPDAILLKPGPLTAEEHRIMQSHTVIGETLCGNLKTLESVRPIIRHHHERLDGSGYPDGLKGDEVPLLAQVISIVDVYDALTTARPYKPALSSDEALAILRDEVVRGWKRGDLVEAFASIAHGLTNTLTGSFSQPGG